MIWSCIFRLNIRHVFVVSDFGIEFKVNSGAKGPHNWEFASDNVRIHSFLIYTDLIEYNFIGDTKTFLLRWLSFISKLKDGDNQSTGQKRKCQTFSSDRCSKNLFILFILIWETQLAKKYPSYLQVLLVSFWCLEKTSDVHF